MANRIDVLTAFYLVLGRIDAEYREPTAIQDRCLKTAFDLMETAPDEALRALQRLDTEEMGRQGMRPVAQREPSVRWVRDWRRLLGGLPR